MQKIKLLTFITILLFCQGSTFVINPANNAVVHNERGLFYMDSNYYGAAIQEFRLAIMLNPRSEVSSAFYNNLAMAYYKIGDYKAAEINLKEAIKLKPYYIEYCENLIKTYRQENILENITKDYNNKLVQDKNDLQAYFMLGLIQKKYGNSDLASDYLRKFLKLAPDLRISKQIRAIVKDLK